MRTRPPRLAAALVAALVAAVGLGACADPADVVHRAVEAARSGDRDAYAACFTERSRPILRAFWQATDAHNPALGQLAAAEVEIASVRRASSREREGERAIVAIVERGVQLRLVLHRTGSTWRIDLLDTEKESMGANTL